MTTARTIPTLRILTTARTLMGMTARMPTAMMAPMAIPEIRVTRGTRVILATRGLPGTPAIAEGTAAGTVVAIVAVPPAETAEATVAETAAAAMAVVAAATEAAVTAAA